MIILVLPQVSAAKSSDNETEKLDSKFQFNSNIESDGTVSLDVNILKKLSTNEDVQLIVVKYGSKDVVYDNTKKNKHYVKNLVPGEVYFFTLKFYNKHNKTSEIESYSGFLTIKVKTDEITLKTYAPVVNVYEIEHSFYTESTEQTEIIVQGVNRYEIESNNSFGTANQTYDDDNMYGLINPSNDVDYYKVMFSGSGSANFYLGNIPSGRDYDLYVYDSSYNLIASSTNGSNSDELISNQSIFPNTWYYIRVVGYNGSFDPYNYYLLRAKATYGGTPDQYENNDFFSWATPVSKYADISANLHSSYDVDFFKFELQEGKRAYNNLKITLSNIPYGTDYDLKVYNSSQVEIGSSTRGGNSTEEITLTIPQGTYYVKVYSYSGSSNSNYNLSIRAGFSALGWSYFTSTAYTNVSSHYGLRGSEFHKGIDIGRNQVTVYNVQDGVVIGNGWNPCMGNFVAVKTIDSEATTGKPLVTRTIHLQSIDSSVPKANTNTIFKKGSIIGVSGNTGSCTTGPHIHFDVNFATQDGTVDGNQMNESNTINPAQFWPNLFPNYQTYVSESGAIVQGGSQMHSAIDGNTEDLTKMKKYDTPEYTFDSRLIEYVGRDQFFAWVDSVPLDEQTVENFKKHFNISDSLEKSILNGEVNSNN
jgi:hypothetical protein